MSWLLLLCPTAARPAQGGLMYWMRRRGSSLRVAVVVS